ncbi:MAG: peptidylprolyl isomerase [Holosporaceae bacterium]|nr:peptidylprolyl isomerase [Holosporaceae bacterium]
MRSLLYFSLTACLFFSYFPNLASDAKTECQSKEYDGIIAIVNGDIITFRDLEKRVQLTLFSSGGAATNELKSRISREVLNEMIQENLKWQCAMKYAPRGGWVSEDAVKATFSDIARRNNLDYDGFCKLLKSQGIDKDVLLRQIRVNLSWVSYINARFGKFVNISESEINRTATEMKEKRNQESYYVQRMFFPVSDVKDESAVSSHVNNLRQMLLKGADFSGLARQFSKSPDAANGGEMGWAFQGQLSAEENAALGKMSIGTYAVVRNSRGYVILFLRDKKEAGSNTFTTLKFVQVVMPFFNSKPDNEEISRLKDYLTDMKKKSRNCHEFIKNAKSSGICGVSDPIILTLEAIQPQFRSIISPLQSGSVGEPIATPNGIIAICMMDRKTQTIPEPTNDDLRAQKTNERLSVYADREIHDLKKKSEIKISDKYKSRRHLAR